MVKAIPQPWVLNVIGALFFVSSVTANPSGMDPNRPLSTHATISEAKDLVPALYESYTEVEEFLRQARDRGPDLSRISEKRIATSAARVWKARRDANHLTLMAEPAAEDLQRKFHVLATELDKLGLQYSGTPKGQKLVQRIRAKLTREKPRLLKFLQQADRALSQGKLELFEKQMELKGQDLARQLVFFSPTARKPFNAEFTSILGKGDETLRKQRKQEYQARAGEAINAELTKVDQFKAEAERVRDEIVKESQTTLNDSQTGGPVQAFRYIGQRWGAASAALSRAEAIQWAFTNRSRVNFQPSHEQLKTTASRALADVIDAAAQTVEADQAQATYSQFLEQISDVGRRLGVFSADLTKACQPALEKLIAKDAGLAQRIDSYRSATDETLRWRSDFALQQAQYLARQFPPIAAQLTAQAELKESIRPPFVPKPPTKSVIAPTMFNAPANWMVHEAASRLIGKPVLTDELYRLSASVPAAVVPYQSGFYANVKVPMSSDTQRNDLRSALLIDSDHGPLTMDSADAIASARLHDYVAVGGVIENVHLESVVTRFAGLPEVAYALSPLGQGPKIPSEPEPRMQTCWRLDVQPLWAQHKYFTVRAASQ